MSKVQNLGFTLIELMVTIAVLAIVLAIAAPNLVAFINTTKVKGVAENMAQDFTLSRAEAIRLNRPIRLDMRSTCYGLTSAATACNCTITDINSTSYCAIKQVSISPSITMTADSGHYASLIFDSVRGMPSNSSGTLTSAQNVSISNSTAAAKVNLNIIGNVCISSPAGNKKISTYPNAC